MKRFLPWILVLFPAFVFVQSLPFKFTGAEVTQHIFGTIGAWFGSIGMGFLLIGTAIPMMVVTPIETSSWIGSKRRTLCTPTRVSGEA